jgi:hypothetical protein
MSDTDRRDRDRRLRGRARLLEFLKFRVLASQEDFFAAWHLEEHPQAPLEPAAPPADLPPLDLVAFRSWLEPLWPEATALGDDDLQHCLTQAHRLYVDPGPHRRS